MQNKLNETQHKLSFKQKGKDFDKPHEKETDVSLNKFCTPSSSRLRAHRKGRQITPYLGLRQIDRTLAGNAELLPSFGIQRARGAH